MKQLFFVILLFSLIDIKAQNISSILELNDPEPIRNGRGKKIVETCSNISSVQTKIVTQPGTSIRVKQTETVMQSATLTLGKGEIKTLRTLNQDNQVLVEKTYVNGELLNTKSYQYDESTGLKTELEIIKANNQYYEKSLYEYDAENHCIGIKTLDRQGNLIYRTGLQNNDLGYPIELKTFNWNGARLGGIEYAEYFQEEDRYISMMVNMNNDTLNRMTRRLNLRKPHLSPKEGEVYNEYNDLIKESCGENCYRVYEYEYDDRGNWTNKKYYTVTTNERGEETRFQFKISERKIKYWKD
ncbi:MAG: hypothetical protein AB8H47_29465 [Bacteroidia bacterium]